MKTKELKKELLEILENNSINSHVPDYRFIRAKDYERVVSDIISLLVKNEAI